MKFSLRKVFGARMTGVATGAGLALTALLSGSQVGQQQAAPDPDMCIATNQADNFNSATQLQLRDMLDEARRSLTAWHVLLDSWKAGTNICMEEGLSNPLNSKQIYIGSYHHDINTIKLNPDTDNIYLINVLVHEARHQQQITRGIEWAVGGNFPEHERMIINWLRDADARVASIVFAYEMERLGEPQYMEALATKGANGHMVAAFQKSLQDKPGDIKEAMRAALRAFRDHASLARVYDYQAVEWIENGGQQFRTDLPQKTLLTRALLMKLGKMEPYGNYMNDELIEFIRQSITPEDYAVLRERFHNNTFLRQTMRPHLCIEEHGILPKGGN